MCVCVRGQRPGRWDKQWRARRRPCLHCLLREEQRRRCGIVSSCLKLLDGGFGTVPLGGSTALLQLVRCSPAALSGGELTCISVCPHTHVHTHTQCCLPASSLLLLQAERNPCWQRASVVIRSLVFSCCTVKHLAGCSGSGSQTHTSAVAVQSHSPPGEGTSYPATAPSDPGRTAGEKWWVAESETAVTLPWANPRAGRVVPGLLGGMKGGMSNRQTQGQRQMCARIDEEIYHRLSEPKAFAFLKRSLHWRLGYRDLCMRRVQLNIRCRCDSHAAAEELGHLFIM